MAPDPLLESNQLGEADELLAVRPRRRPIEETDMDITPMIDMTFLLLIFFLVTSRMAAESPVDLPPALYGDAVAMKNAVVVTVIEGPAGDAVYFLGDGTQDALRVQAADPAALERELIEYIRAGLAGSPRKHHVLIKAARRVKHKHVARVAHAAGQAADAEKLLVAVLEAK